MMYKVKAEVTVKAKKKKLTWRYRTLEAMSMEFARINDSLMRQKEKGEIDGFVLEADL